MSSRISAIGRATAERQRTVLPSVPFGTVATSVASFSGAAASSSGRPAGAELMLDIAWAEAAVPAADTPADFPELLSSAEVQAIFNRSARALRDWMRKGRLRHVKIGHSLFFLAEDVRRLVAEGLRRGIEARTEKSTRTRTGMPCPEPHGPPHAARS